MLLTPGLIMLLKWKIASKRVTENIPVKTAASKLRIVVLDKITTPVHEYNNY